MWMLGYTFLDNSSRTPNKIQTEKVWGKITEGSVVQHENMDNGGSLVKE